MIDKETLLNWCIGAAVIIIVSLIVGLSVNNRSTHPLSIISHWPSFLQKVSLEKAHTMYKERFLFIDARTLDMYNDSHIPGAYNLDYYELDKSYGNFSKKYSTETQMVIYCEGIDGSDTCETSRFLAERLLDNGYRNIYLFEGGFSYWSKAGYPVISAEKTSKKTERMPWINYIRDLSMLAFGILAIGFRKKRYAIISMQLLLGAIFIISGSTKIFSPEKLAVILRAYKIFPDISINFLAIFMPWLEFFSGFALLAGIVPQSAALLIAGMNMGFIPALSYRAFNVSQQLGIPYFAVNFDCGCGLGENYAWVLSLRDAGFLLMGLTLLLMWQTIWELRLAISRRRSDSNARQNTKLSGSE